MAMESEIPPATLVQVGGYLTAERFFEPQQIRRISIALLPTVDPAAEVHTIDVEACEFSLPFVVDLAGGGWIYKGEVKSVISRETGGFDRLATALLDAGYHEEAINLSYDGDYFGVWIVDDGPRGSWRSRLPQIVDDLLAEDLDDLAILSAVELLQEAAGENGGAGADDAS
jgi:hypothetical protein